jgi:hypothetical protein
MLRSQDFRDQEAVEAQRRWWHNRALHNAFGIAYGFEVELSDGWLKVGPGVGYDCFGRELVLQESVDLAIPEEQPDVAGLVLVACYQETDHYPDKDRIIALCLPERQSALQERTDFCWKAADRVDIRDGVPLARLVRSGGGEVVERESPGLAYKLDPTLYPRPARAMARPHIGSGATLPGNTAWELWYELVDNVRIPLGWQVTVDTSAAGFTEIPCYFAWLQGPLWDRNTGDFFPVPLEHIAGASATEFTFRLYLPTQIYLPDPLAFLADRREEASTSNRGFEMQFLAFAQKQRLFVSWLGIQPRHRRNLQNEVKHGTA